MKHPIPDKVFDNHVAVLGKTGSGKTYAIRGCVEWMLERKERVCIVDPTGAWHGLRSSKSGKGDGYPVVIFGGEHGDLPLQEAHGELLAEVIGGSNTPTIIDTSLMRVRERTRFMTDFADALMRKNKGPLQLVIDEAHLFMPQGKVNSPQAGEMLSATNNMVSGGRSRGLRIVLITQRPAKLHKDSLTQAETLIAMRLIAPQDRHAVEEWIEDNADESKAKEILSSLAGLKTGTGWLWAPGLDLLEKVSFPAISTFDSGAAPSGEGKAVHLAPINLSAIEGKLKAVSASALDNDPKNLKAQIAALKKELVAKGKPDAHAGDLKSVAELAHARGQAAGWKAAMGGRAKRDKGILDAVLLAVREAFSNAPEPEVYAGGQPTPRAMLITPPRTQKNLTTLHTIVEASAKVMEDDVQHRQRSTRGASTNNLGKMENAILGVLAQYEEGCAMGKLALLAGYRVSGGWRNALSALRTAGLIEGGNTGIMTITQAGMIKGPYHQPLRDVNYWANHFSFGTMEKQIIGALDTSGDGLSIDQLANRTGYSISGGFRNALSSLRTAGVIVGRNGDTMRLSPDIPR